MEKQVRVNNINPKYEMFYRSKMSYWNTSLRRDSGRGYKSIYWRGAQAPLKVDS